MMRDDAQYAGHLALTSFLSKSFLNLSNLGILLEIVPFLRRLPLPTKSHLENEERYLCDRKIVCQLRRRKR